MIFTIIISTPPFFVFFGVAVIASEITSLCDRQDEMRLILMRYRATIITSRKVINPRCLCYLSIKFIDLFIMWRHLRRYSIFSTPILIPLVRFPHILVIIIMVRVPFVEREQSPIKSFLNGTFEFGIKSSTGGPFYLRYSVVAFLLKHGKQCAEFIN